MLTVSLLATRIRQQDLECLSWSSSLQWGHRFHRYEPRGRGFDSCQPHQKSM